LGNRRKSGHTRGKENGKRSPRGQNVNIHIKAGNCTWCLCRRKSRELLGWSKIDGKRAKFGGPYEDKIFAHLQAKRLTLLRSRRAAVYPANKVKIACLETPKRNGLLA
jgi:hypothetical protein